MTLHTYPPCRVCYVAHVNQHSYKCKLDYIYNYQSLNHLGNMIYSTTYRIYILYDMIKYIYKYKQHKQNNNNKNNAIQAIL